MKTTHPTKKALLKDSFDVKTRLFTYDSHRKHLRIVFEHIGNNSQPKQQLLLLNDAEIESIINAYKTKH